MTPLDQASRDRIINFLAFDLEDLLDQNDGHVSAKALAICALNSMELLPEMLEMLHTIAKKAVRANRTITFAQNFYPKDPH
jgi:hypothetical protein